MSESEIRSRYGAWGRLVFSALSVLVLLAISQFYPKPAVAFELYNISGISLNDTIDTAVEKIKQNNPNADCQPLVLGIKTSFMDFRIPAGMFCVIEKYKSIQGRNSIWKYGEAIRLIAWPEREKLTSIVRFKGFDQPDFIGVDAAVSDLSNRFGPPAISRQSGQIFLEWKTATAKDCVLNSGNFMLDNDYFGQNFGFLSNNVSPSFNENNGMSSDLTRAFINEIRNIATNNSNCGTLFQVKMLYAGMPSPNITSLASGIVQRLIDTTRAKAMFLALSKKIDAESEAAKTKAVPTTTKPNTF